MIGSKNFFFASGGFRDEGGNGKLICGVLFFLHMTTTAPTSSLRYICRLYL